MTAEKIREWNESEIQAKEREFSEQLFRLKFQMASGQAGVLAKIRELRKDIARIKTIRREAEIQAKR
ncbi:MAG TPA: 50S ribosomal protein L29 [Terriglobia bacterium]|nr:50S ribosomal protein L29 [Terriglobia bacterium]